MQAQLPIHFKIIQASRKILEAVDLFVALATVKLKCFICDNAVQFRSERIGAREITRVILTGQNRPDRADSRPWLPQAERTLGQGRFCCEVQDFYKPTGNQYGVAIN